MTRSRSIRIGRHEGALLYAALAVCIWLLGATMMELSQPRMRHPVVGDFLPIVIGSALSVGLALRAVRIGRGASRWLSALVLLASVAPVAILVVATITAPWR